VTTFLHWAFSTNIYIQVPEAGQETGVSQVLQDDQSGQPGSVTETGVPEGAENGKRKIDGEDETAAKRTKVVETGAAMEQDGVKLWDVNRDGVEGPGVERQGKRTIDFRGEAVSGAIDNGGVTHSSVSLLRYFVHVCALFQMVQDV
jgi:hypothetical protein